MNCDHNKSFGLFTFQSGYRKLHLNSPKGYSRKIINAQTASNKEYLKINKKCHYRNGRYRNKRKMTYDLSYLEEPIDA